MWGVDNLVHLGLRCESKHQSCTIRSTAFVLSRHTPSKFGSSSLRLWRRKSGHKEVWPRTLDGCTRCTSLLVPSYILLTFNINWEVSEMAHGISSIAPISPHRDLIYQLESRSSVSSITAQHRSLLLRLKALEIYPNKKVDNGKQGHEAVASVHNGAHRLEWEQPCRWYKTASMQRPPRWRRDSAKFVTKPTETPDQLLYL